MHHRLHGFRHRHHTHVGQVQAAFVFAAQRVNRLHADLLDRQRDQPEQQVLLQVHVLGYPARHPLRNGLRRQLVAHQGADLLMGVFTQPRIEADIHRQGKIAESIHAEGPAQVHRNGDLHRPGFPAGPSLRLLPLGHSLRQYGCQVCRHGHTLLMRFFLQDIRRHNAGGDIAEAACFRRSAEPVGGILRPAQSAVRSAGKEAVPCFLFPGALLHVHNMSFRRNRHAVLQPKVLGCQVFQQNQAARSVCNGMEHFHGDSVFIIEKSHAAGFQFPAGHMGQRIGEILLGFRSIGDRLQVIPEKTSSQPDKVSGKPGFQVGDRLIQDFRINRFLQRRGNPEHIVPVFPDDRRKYQSGIIKPVPLFFHFFLRMRRKTNNPSSLYTRKNDITMHIPRQTSRHVLSIHIIVHCSLLIVHLDTDGCETV